MYVYVNHALLSHLIAAACAVRRCGNVGAEGMGEGSKARSSYCEGSKDRALQNTSYRDNLIL